VVGNRGRTRLGHAPIDRGDRDDGSAHRRERGLDELGELVRRAAEATADADDQRAGATGVRCGSCRGGVAGRHRRGLGILSVGNDRAERPRTTLYSITPTEIKRRSTPVGAGHGRRPVITVTGFSAASRWPPASGRRRFAWIVVADGTRPW